MKQTHTPMVVAAARALAKQHAEACGTNAADVWTFYAEDFKAEAKAVLEGAGVPDLLAALKALVQQVERGDFDHIGADHPDSAVGAARAAIAKAEVTA
jgi:hypothetical protein